MALSSDDVVNWQLKTGMRGYLIPQVDELLDEVADELDRLHGRIRELEAEREAVKNSLDDQLEVEETLRRTLYQAQKAADQTIDDAKVTADQIVADGRLESDAILAAAREKAHATYEDAVKEATDERAAVRSSLEAEETRMRAVRSELRAEIEHLQTIESETRRLLRGLYEDRLNELSEPLATLPSTAGLAEPLVISDAPAVVADAGGVSPPGLADASVPDLVVEDAPQGDEADLVVMPPGPAEAMGTDVGVPDVSERPDAVDGDEAESAPTDVGDLPAEARDVLAPSPRPEPQEPLATRTDAEGRSADGAPAYLDAVSEALAAIQANDDEDAVEDDLLDDAADLQDATTQNMSPPRPRAEDLFEDVSPRRRRRSG